jgi:hypothetical protein
VPCRCPFSHRFDYAPWVDRTLGMNDDVRFDDLVRAIGEELKVRGYSGSKPDEKPQRWIWGKRRGLAHPMIQRSY